MVVDWWGWTAAPDCPLFSSRVVLILVLVLGLLKVLIPGTSTKVPKYLECFLSALHFFQFSGWIYIISTWPLSSWVWVMLSTLKSSNCATVLPNTCESTSERSKKLGPCLLSLSPLRPDLGKVSRLDVEEIVRTTLLVCKRRQRNLFNKVWQIERSGEKKAFHSCSLVQPHLL